MIWEKEGHKSIWEITLWEQLTRVLLTRKMVSARKKENYMRPRVWWDGRGWDGWMASLTQWTRVWTNSGRQWRTEEPGRLWFIGLQRVGHDWATEQFKTEKHGGFPFRVPLSCMHGWLGACLLLVTQERAKMAVTLSQPGSKITVLKKLFVLER